MKRRRVVLWFVVTAALVAVLAIATRSGTPTLQERADSIDRRIACPVCTGESVAESNAGVSREIRADVLRRLKAGESSDAIITYYARTGRKILAPADSGIDLLAWAIPIGAALLALCALVFTLVRWRREPRQIASTADEELVAEAPDLAPSPRLTPAMRDELEAEREFLLQSLDDLERERTEGGIDADTYERLHSDYTARTAQVLRSLREGNDRRPKKPAVPAGRRALLGVGAVVFATGAAFSLAKASGQRGANGTISGRQGVAATTTTAPVPNTYAGHLAAAQRARAAGNILEATKQYVAASQLDRTQAAPHSGLGCMLVLQASSQPDPRLIDSAKSQLDQALALEAKEPDATLCTGLYYIGLKNAPATGRPYLVRYLQVVPKDAPTRAMAQQLLAQIDAPSTTTTTKG